MTFTYLLTTDLGRTDLLLKVGSAMSLQYEVLPLYNLSTISSIAPTSGPANGRASFVLNGSNLKVNRK